MPSSEITPAGLVVAQALELAQHGASEKAEPGTQQLALVGVALGEARGQRSDGRGGRRVGCHFTR